LFKEEANNAARWQEYMFDWPLSSMMMGRGKREWREGERTFYVETPRLMSEVLQMSAEIHRRNDRADE
jgi:hypothetical protein